MGRKQNKAKLQCYEGTWTQNVWSLLKVRANKKSSLTFKVLSICPQIKHFLFANSSNKSTFDDMAWIITPRLFIPWVWDNQKKVKSKSHLHFCLVLVGERSQITLTRRGWWAVQKCRLFSTYIRQRRGGRVGGQKSQKFVNVVCERPLASPAFFWNKGTFTNYVDKTR